ncbi:MAG TPA: ATP-binding protein [Acidimicrobiales bacterium]
MGKDRSSRVDVLRLPISAKLAAALAVPLIPVLVVTLLEVRQAAADADEVRDESRLATAATGPNSVVNALQDERSWAVLALTGLESQFDAPVEGYDATRQATDEAIVAFRESTEEQGGSVEEVYRGTLEALAQVEEIRAEIDADTAVPSAENMEFSTHIYDRYSDLIEQALDANSRVALELRDNDLRSGTELAQLAAVQFEVMANLSRETLVAALMSPNGLDTNDEIRRVSGLLSTFQRNNREIETFGGTYAPVVEAFHPREMIVLVEERVNAAIETRRIEDIPSFLDGTAPGPDEGFTRLRDEVLEVVTDRADTLDRQATNRQRLFGLVALLAFAGAGLMTWLVSQSITRPLRHLTVQARDVARRRLPTAVQGILQTRLGGDVEVPEIEPLEVASRDEIADVVEALNAVQASAVDLAVGQAVLRRNIADSFLNLGRRNQNLLGRQLDFITELESKETDPDALASLFRLDHLATRMRRNAESLLVLAGVEPPRKWTAPVRLGDVIRAALGEVEDFERIKVEHVHPASIVGSAAADLAHLLAELIENALRFSSPDDPVVIRGAWWGQEHYRLTIVDQGIGMSEEAIEQANRRLAGTESFTVAPSKYLGHYVAGHLAARHDIAVELRPAGRQGIVSTIDLPPTLCEPVGDPRLGGPATLEPVGAGGPMPMPAPVAAAPVVGPTPLAPPVRLSPAVPAGAAAPAAPAAPGAPAASAAISSMSATSSASAASTLPAMPSAPTAAEGPSHPGGPVPTPMPATPTPTTPVGAAPGGGADAGSPPPARPAGRTTVGATPTDEVMAALREHLRSLQAGMDGPPAAGPTETRGRLPQRQRGAHLPTTRPTPVRRAGATPGPTASAASAPGPAGQGAPPPRSSPQDVYSFLSGFHAGVQRGLDESRRHQR